MYMLGELFSKKEFTLSSSKISRYYFELAAEKQFTKAMVRMYHILKEKEIQTAVNYLREAIKHPFDGEELFEMGNVFLEGNSIIEKDAHIAREFFGKASALGYHPAKEKLTML